MSGYDWRADVDRMHEYDRLVAERGGLILKPTRQEVRQALSTVWQNPQDMPTESTFAAMTDAVMALLDRPLDPTVEM